MPAKKTTPTFPTKEQLLDYIKSQPRPVSRRDIARAFQIKGAERIPMKAILKDLIVEGELERYGGSYHKPEKRELIQVEIYDVDDNGDFIARPLQWDKKGRVPEITIFPPRGHRGRYVLQLKVGDQALVRLLPLGKFTYEGQVVRKIEKHVAEHIVGKFVESRFGGWIEPSDRRLPARIPVQASAVKGAITGDLVLADISHRERQEPGHAVIAKVLGRADDPFMFSVIAEYEHNLPNKFSEEAIKLAEQAKLPTLKGREDLRGIPLVTIDGEDARDFDDAVWAAADPEYEGSWQVIVAIADVAYYVRPEDALDLTARERGNSVYFPDRVIPMLPEALSNEMCSLKPGVDRACLAVHMWIDSKGRVHKYKFMRGLMRSQARLTYTQVQHAMEGEETDLTPDFITNILKPLYGVYEALKKARQRRGTIDLDLPEQQVIFDKKGHIEKVVVRERYDSHRLIEELMIAANVAAATTLEDKKQPCMYRIHEPPDPAKVGAVAQVLQELGYPKLKSLDVSHSTMNKFLIQAKGHEDEDLVNMLILRAMTQACYSPNNVGHYGLNLQKYCHFTSPIRRYSDVLVHRALISAFNMGEGFLKPLNFEEVGRHISETEREATLAERDTLDRFMAAYMAGQENKIFEGQIVSVNKFGLFITIKPIGATGYLPIRAISDDYYLFQEQSHQLIGRRKKKRFRLGQKIKVGIAQVIPLTGSISLQYIIENKEKRKKHTPLVK